MVLDDVPGYARFEYEADLVTAIPFDIQKLIDVNCTFEGENGSSDELKYSTDFLVATYDGVLTFTLDAAYTPPETYGQLLIYRDVKQEQKLSIPSGKEIPTKPLEWLLDRIVWMLQEIRRSLGDILVSTDSDDPTYQLPSIANRAGKLLGYNEDGDPVAVERPSRYPASPFVREAYVEAVDQRSYADAFRLSGQSIDDGFIKSFIKQNYHAKQWRPVTDFGDGQITEIIAGFTTQDRYVTGGRVAYLLCRITGLEGLPIIRLNYDMTYDIMVQQFEYEGITFLSSPDENVFYYGNQKGFVEVVNASTLAEKTLSWDIWKGASSEVVADSSFAFYFTFPGNWDTNVAYNLHYTTDVSNTEAVWTTVLDPHADTFCVIMLSNGHGDRLKYLAASNGGLWETDDPSGTWTRPGSNAFIMNTFRKGLCWSEHYSAFFSFSVYPDGDILYLYVERSDVGEEWELIETIELPGTMIASNEVYGTGTVYYSEFDSPVKQIASMITDDEVGTITMHYADIVIVYQPEAEYSIKRQGIDWTGNRGLYVKGLGITIDYLNLRYIKAAVPLIPSSTELPDDVIVVYDDNYEFIIAYNDDPDYIIKNEE